MQLDFIRAASGIYHMGPAPERGGTDLIILPESAFKTQKPSLYNVVMLNDDYTPMEYVVGLLQRHFSKSAEEAKQLMLEIHTKGKTIAGTYTFDVADTKATEACQDAKNHQHPFMVKCEKA